MIRYSISDAVAPSDCMIIPVFAGKRFEKQVSAFDAAYGGVLSRMREQKDFVGKRGQMSMQYPADHTSARVLFVGLGEEKAFSIRTWKQAMGAATIAAQSKKCATLQYLLTAKVAKKLGAMQAARSLVLALEVAQYSFDEHKSEKSRVTPVQTVHMLIGEGTATKEIKKGIAEGTVLAESVNFTRHLGNTNPSVMTPTYLANEVKAMARGNKQLTVKVLSRPDMEKMGMGGLLGVAQGSVEEPKFIIIEYKGSTTQKNPTVLVGKGITFDSGGLSLKPGNYMMDMKFDMLGAATVIGILKAAAGLTLKKHIIGLVPSCENMPSGSSYRPDDILVAMNGKSILVENTDAEGRLILADALSYATMKLEPKEVIDFATLTGACMVALGNERSGLFGTDDKLAAKLTESGDTVGEQLWRLPIGEEYSEAMKSEIADIKNLGGVGHPRYGGASTAAAFLQFFTKNEEGKTPYPWAHIDLSCSYYGGKGKPYIRGGANGFGVETVIEYLRK